ncbi:SET domain-containing protein, partial [Rhizophagus irregularis]
EKIKENRKFIIEDISNGLERFPVSLIYDEIKEFEELRNIFYKYVNNCVTLPGTTSDSYYDGCDCKDDCESEDCGCKSTHGFFYVSRGLNPAFLQSTSILPNISVYECNSNCSCSSVKCPNRLTQHGVSLPLQIFKSNSGCGWGVRSHTRKIRKGEFVCEYAGEIIKTDEAKRRWITAKEKNEDNYILCLKEHVKDRILRTNIDPTHIGNVGRFINHSCDSNLQIFLTRINSLIPTAALFAKRDIEINEELSFDYAGGMNDNNDNIQEININTERKKCLCGSQYCKKFLPFDQSL